MFFFFVKCNHALKGTNYAPSYNMKYKSPVSPESVWDGSAQNTANIIY